MVLSGDVLLCLSVKNLLFYHLGSRVLVVLRSGYLLIVCLFLSDQWPCMSDYNCVE